MRSWVFLFACLVAWLVQEYGGEKPLPTGWLLHGDRVDLANCKAYSAERPEWWQARPVGLRCPDAIDRTTFAGARMPIAFDPAWRGKRVVMHVPLRVRNVNGEALVWLRVDSAERTIEIDNMKDRRISGTSEDWLTATVAVDVEESATQLAGGVILQGGGTVEVMQPKIAALRTNEVIKVRSLGELIDITPAKKADVPR